MSTPSWCVDTVEQKKYFCRFFPIPHLDQIITSFSWNFVQFTSILEVNWSTLLPKVKCNIVEYDYPPR